MADHSRDATSLRAALQRLHDTVSYKARFRDKDSAVAEALVVARTALEDAQRSEMEGPVDRNAMETPNYSVKVEGELAEIVFHNDSGLPRRIADPQVAETVQPESLAAGPAASAPSASVATVGELIEAAGKYANAYDGDDRQDIVTDVLNAFYAGARYQASARSAIQPSAWPPLTVEDGVFAKWLRGLLRDNPYTTLWNTFAWQAIEKWADEVSRRAPTDRT